jgi:hypothetical protein
MVRSRGGTDTNEKWVEELIPEGTFLYVLGSARPYKEQRPEPGRTHPRGSCANSSSILKPWRNTTAMATAASMPRSGSWPAPPWKSRCCATIWTRRIQAAPGTTRF